MDCLGPTLTIPQGADHSITATAIRGSDGNPLDVTGWAVHAVIRAPGTGGPIVGEWSTTPTGAMGVASVSGTTVTLQIAASMFTDFNWSRGILQTKVTEPGPGRTERLIDRPVRLSPDVVTP